MNASYEVVISLTDPLTRAQVAAKVHPVADLHAAGVLVGNIRECIEQMGDYLPGLKVEVYEVAETWRPTAQGAALLEEMAAGARAGKVRTASDWAVLIAAMAE